MTTFYYINDKNVQIWKYFSQLFEVKKTNVAKKRNPRR